MEKQKLNLDSNHSSDHKSMAHGGKSHRRNLLTIISVLLIISLSTVYIYSSSETKLQQVEPFSSEAAEQGGWLLHSLKFTSGGDNGSCVSLRERHLFYPPTHLKPSHLLLASLRQYESMHRKCVGNIHNWKDHFSNLQEGFTECKYLIWKEPTGGMGNRLISLVGAFEYALLTHRSLLVHRSLDLEELICNPFDGSSIWLPSSFPLADLETAPHIHEFEDGKTHSEGQKDLGRTDIAYAFLQHYITEPEYHFYCDSLQSKLEGIPWLLFESNQYIGPGLFYVPAFESKLLSLFPDRVVTSHMVRYLLLPTNKVWKRIATVYRAYFGFNNQKIGIQVRTFGKYEPAVSTRIAACLNDKKIVPVVETDDSLDNDTSLNVGHPRKSTKVKLLFVTSLDYGFFEDLKKYYSDAKTSDDSVIAVHSESHEGHEVHSLGANQKVMVEIWLLSMTDVLLISEGSTFGYIANALHGQREAYYMNIRSGQWEASGRPECERAWSSASCYHVPPKVLKCGEEKSLVVDGNPTLEYLRSCQDSSYGISLLPLL